MSAANQVDWFQIGTDRPEAAERFYSDVFGWKFAGEPGYRLVFTPGSPAPAGGFADVSDGSTGPHAIPFVNVADTAETCRRAETAGAKILVAPADGGDGLVFAHLIDPTGNHIGVYTPAGG
ncbi:VOC family protein [Paractinoplanes ferrugineus]|uniref:Glyoxalase n=1 Tax=Paractinoplanes ferrugineus TaxID=113564 RepID=A0A919MJP2_9ACTN|nr:VOC family protein [Actinoplanes ferrugineus]GIE14940.1 glyoxalase [Actinoplanes ferrugineus]